MDSGVFLDLDGTLVDSLEDICWNLNAVRETCYGLPRRTTEELRPAIGHGSEHLARHGVPELPETELPRVIERFRAFYMDNPYAGGSLYPGVRETLTTLKAMPHLKVAVVTNKMTAIAEVTLAHYLPGFDFDLIAGADSVSRCKPHAAHLLEVAVKVGALPQKSWMVGDHAVDRQCAEAAGARFLAAGYGFGGVEGVPGRILSAFPEVLQHVKLG
jgi:phosphoglycolate phosphatase